MDRAIFPTWRCIIVALLVCVVSVQESAGERITHTVGGSMSSWVESREASVDLDLLTRSGWIQPRRLRVPPKNLASRALIGPGRIWTSLDPDPLNVALMIDDDQSTGCKTPISGPVTVYLDLGGVFGVNEVGIWPAPTPGKDYQHPQVLEVGVNRGDPRDLDARGFPLLHRVWRSQVDGYSILRVRFPTTRARYVGLTVSETDLLRVHWILVYGEGYVYESSYVSGVINFGDMVTFGRIWWEGERDEDAKVLIRTRSGNDDTPDVYWRRVTGKKYRTYLSSSGEYLTGEEYRRLSPGERAGITPDTDHWSTWSAPYPFEEGGEGTPIAGAMAGQYFQVRVDFEGTFERKGSLHLIRVDVSRPVPAYRVIGEIFPTEVKPAELSTFTYAIRARIRGKDTGFDCLEIETPRRAGSVRSVRLDRTEVPFTTEYLEHPTRLVVHFPKLGLTDDNGLLEVDFDCAVLRYGTEFAGRVYDSESDHYPQPVLPGDAREDAGEDDLFVRIDLEKPLILSTQAFPNPFTPNGDGINEETEISYSLLKLSEDALVKVEIYDVGGRLLRTLYSGGQREGSYACVWDGRDGKEQEVPPGIYVYRICVEPDIGHQGRIGTVSVVY